MQFAAGQSHGGAPQSRSAISTCTISEILKWYVDEGPFSIQRGTRYLQSPQLSVESSLTLTEPIRLFHSVLQAIFLLQAD